MNVIRESVVSLTFFFILFIFNPSEDSGNKENMVVACRAAALSAHGKPPLLRVRASALRKGRCTRKWGVEISTSQRFLLVSMQNRTCSRMHTDRSRGDRHRTVFCVRPVAGLERPPCRSTRFCSTGCTQSKRRDSKYASNTSSIYVILCVVFGVLVQRVAHRTIPPIRPMRSSVRSKIF